MTLHLHDRGRRAVRFPGFPGAGILLLAALAFSSFGCAYYNTFFLARKYFNQAMAEEKRNTTGKLSPSASATYEKAIKQCSKVLQRYDHSKWADDALFLMGRAYFGREEFSQSRRWLDELITTQPKSPYIPAAQYWEGRGWLAENDYDKAGDAFQRVLDEFPKYKDRDEVQFYLAEVDFKQDRFATAVEKYNTIIQRFPKSEFVTDALIRVGDAQFSQKKYDAAQGFYERAMARTRDPKQRFDTRLKVGQALEKQERYSDALQTYRAMSEELVPKDRLLRIMAGAETAQGRQASDPGQNPNIYDPGDQYNTQGNVNSGVNTNPNDPNYNPNTQGQNYGGSTNQNYGNTPGQAGGQNYGGNTNQNYGGNTNQNYGGNTNQNYGGNTNQNYGQNQNYGGDGNQDSRLAVAAAVQANPLASELPRVLLRQGLSLSEMGRNEEAIKTFRAITAAYPRTSEASEAQYRIGYIQEVYLEDYEAARLSYDAARQQGVSTFSDQARRRADGLARLVALQAADSLKTKGSDATQTEAEKQFLAAELYYFQQDKTDKALEEYSAVEKNYPTTPFAAKAALARAWILTFAMQDTSAGRTAYEHVEQAYAGSEQAKIAHQTLTGEVPPEEVRPTPPLLEGPPPASPAEAVARQFPDGGKDSLAALLTGRPSTGTDGVTPPTGTDGVTPSTGTEGIVTPSTGASAPVMAVPAAPSSAAPSKGTSTNVPSPGGVPPATHTDSSRVSVPARADSSRASVVTPAVTPPTSAPVTAPISAPVTNPPSVTAPSVTPPATTNTAPSGTTTTPQGGAAAVVPTPPSAPPSTSAPVTHPPAVTPAPQLAAIPQDVAPAPAGSSRLAPAGATGLPRPLSQKIAPSKPHGGSSQPAKKQKSKKSRGVTPRGSLRPRSEGANADTTGARNPDR